MQDHAPCFIRDIYADINASIPVHSDVLPQEARDNTKCHPRATETLPL